MRPEQTIYSCNYLEARKVTLVGAALDLVLGLLKIGVGIAGHSQALVADGVHSFSDLVTDGLVIWAMKYSAQEADPEHPYGHERMQTFATVILGAALTVVALGLGKEAVERLLSSELAPIPSVLTLVVAAISIGSKEWIYRYTVRVARRLRSSLLEANAWHSRSDALSSVAVFAGILGSLLGFEYLDAIAAIIVAAMVFQVGARLVLEGSRELIDTGIAADDTISMREVMTSIEGVQAIQRFRTRTMGATIVADVDIRVDPNISVSEGHRIAEEIERAVAALTQQNIDITVHIDSEFTHGELSRMLPMRASLEKELTAYWSGISDIAFKRVGLHYRVDQVDVDLYFVGIGMGEATEVAVALATLRKQLETNPHIGEVQAFLQVE